MLFVWLFGIAIGVANACTLGGSAHDAGAPEHVARVVSMPHGDEASGKGHANCQDFCEKTSLGAPAPKVFDDVGLLFAFAAPPSAPSGLIRRPGTPPAARGPWVQHLRGSPPLRIAYQRLVL